MEGLAVSVVLIAILLGVLLVVVFDVFCLLRLGTSDTAHFVPRFVWAVLIVAASPIGGFVYLLAQRLRKGSPEPVTMRPRPLLGSKAWNGPPAHRGAAPLPPRPRATRRRSGAERTQGLAADADERVTFQHPSGSSGWLRTVRQPFGRSPADP